MRAVSSIAALASLLAAACSSAPGSGNVASSQATLASPPPVESQVQAPLAAPAAAGVPRRPIAGDALVEGPQSRDPFRSFPDTKNPPPPDTRPRKARRIPVDQLKLVGLVTHTATPRAMLVDPSGKGYIVTQGELVGRPEVEGDRVASFRVDRIREGDVVLVREDTSSPGAVTGTRVLSLPRDPLLQADD